MTVSPWSAVHGLSPRSGVSRWNWCLTMVDVGDWASSTSSSVVSWKWSLCSPKGWKCPTSVPPILAKGCSYAHLTIKVICVGSFERDFSIWRVPFLIENLIRSSVRVTFWSRWRMMVLAFGNSPNPLAHRRYCRLNNRK